MHPGRSDQPELKLELTRAELQRVRAHPALGALALGAPVTRTLRSIYFDTVDHRLQARGLLLVLRNDGGGWQQAVAARVPAGEDNGRPIEIEDARDAPVPDPRAIGDPSVKRQVRKAINTARLEPIFETVIERTTCQLQTGDGRLELALDEGLLHAGANQNAICEAELGLLSGAPDCLLQTARQLFANNPVRLAEASTAERGYRLARLNRGRSRTLPRRAEQPELTPAATCGEAFSTILQSAAAQIIGNRQAALDSEDPDAAHQLRIGLRRLRSALSAFRPLAGTPALRELEGRARALARSVGELRDADVLIDGICAPVAAASGSAGAFVRLDGVLQAHRTRARERARAELQSERWAVLQLHFALCPRLIAEAGGLTAPLPRFARSALKKRWRKVAEMGERLDELSVAERHAMRKGLKTLRYTAEFFASLYPKARTRRFIADIRNLQEAFGYLNDVAAAEQLIALCRAASADQEVQQAAGFVLGWHNARAASAWRDTHKGWRRLAKEPRFWA